MNFRVSQMSSAYMQRVREISAAQNFKEFYSRYFSGWISPFMTAWCVDTRITPNHLTLMMIPVGLTGSIICLVGTNTAYLLGGLCLVMLNILDAADGELARYTNRTSDFGDYLDRNAHYATNGAALTGLGIGLFFQTGHEFLLALAILSATAITSDDAMRDLLQTCGITVRDQDVSRKEAKAESGLRLPEAVQLLGSVLFSNVALFHLLPVFAVAQMILDDTAVYLLVYYVVFCLATVGRTFLRCYRIFKLYA